MNERVLAWEGCTNVRDLGGLSTGDGRQTRWGAVVRSDTPARLSARGWSALYAVEDFHKLLYSAGQRRLYEGWGHAASIITLEDYRYHRWRSDHRISYNPCFHEWSSKNGNRELAEQTLERIRSGGGLRVGDFEYEDRLVGRSNQSWTASRACCI